MSLSMFSCGIEAPTVPGSTREAVASRPSRWRLNTSNVPPNSSFQKFQSTPALKVSAVYQVRFGFGIALGVTPVRSVLE